MEREVWQPNREKNVQMLGMDLWNGSAGQLNWFKQATGVTFPLLQRAGTKTAYHASLDDLVIVDEAGVVRHKVSALSTSGRRGVTDRVDALLSSAPILELSLKSLNFGQALPLGTSRTVPLQILNSGTADLEVTGISSDLEGVTMQPPSLTVPAGGRQFVTLTLTPAQEGRISGTLSISSKQLEPFGLSIDALTVEALPPPPTDFDSSGRVDFSDFLLFAGAFNSTDPAFDLDGSGRVDFPDFLLFVRAFGQ